MSELFFEDYTIESLSYMKNKQFDMDSKPHLNTDFDAEIIIMDEGNASVYLKTKIGDNKLNAPFIVQAEICGQFTYKKSSDEDIDMTFEDYLSTNAIAILFPYLRSIISDITAKSNEFPTLLLPVLNIARLLKDKHSITINRSSDIVNKDGIE
ncbi:hypothetical protein SLU01_13110 [Sporosarcina luteola]|uniref:Preprotein translocase subunit SecB n=1 Tax=Sporosarcina luteola TaxID=582850 RepID=A0A511Z6D2_9BACL|nr:protein-export chaperone SecB [Sporosarcina luteola]GEN82999.1 hypothetical protein SLU01_13110 [Sporosarcina luteola]